MLDRLRRSFERERRFVADASHELRTPVAVIKTELEGALRAGDHDPQVREALVAAVEECDRLAQLAEDLLVVARTGEGELPMHREPLDVPELLERVRERFAARARERGRAIRVDADGGGRACDPDELRLRQALGNLVDNALRYGEGEVVLRSRRSNGGVELEVSDGAPASRPTSPSAPSSASPAATAPADATAPASGSRSCGRSPRRTAAAPRSCPAAGATVRIWLPDTP